ncbi:MAG: MarC family protein [Methanomassiliicoccus sp.]|nr:MarC family protein [Methanomassiliicoccus sp.]
MDLEFAVSAFATVFAIVNPVGNIPFFFAVTEGYTPEDKKRVAAKTCIVTAAVLFTFALFGQWIFSIYGITIPSFRIAGGILLFSIAFSMLQGQKSKTKITEEEREEAMQKDSVGIVPLGIPMFAGPGAITTVMILVSDATITADAVVRLAAIAGAVILTVIISYETLVHSERIFNLMGKSGAMAFSRIMGLLLAAVAINFVLRGIAQAIPMYGILP